jgi:hypothetical protein
MAGACDTYLAIGANDEAKLAYCNVMANSDPAACTFVKGSNYCAL